MLGEDVGVGDDHRPLARRRDRRDRAHVAGEPGRGVDLRAVELGAEQPRPSRARHDVDVAGAELDELVAQAHGERRALPGQRGGGALAERGRGGQQDGREAVHRGAAGRCAERCVSGEVNGEATTSGEMRDPRLGGRDLAPHGRRGGTAPPTPTDSTLTASTTQTTAPAPAARRDHGLARALLPALAVVLGVAAILRARLRPVPQLRRPLRAALGARPLQRRHPGLHGGLRAHAAPARDLGLRARRPVRRRRRRADDLDHPALLRAAGLAHLPARRDALPPRGRDRHRARRRHPPRALPRRADRLPGHGLRLRDRRRRAARGQAAAARGGRHGPAHPRRADAARRAGRSAGSTRSGCSPPAPGRGGSGCWRWPASRPCCGRRWTGT